MCSCFYLKYLFPADLDAAMAGLRLLLREFLPQDLQLLHQVPLVLGHSQALCLFRQLGRGQSWLGDAGTTLVLRLSRVTGGKNWFQRTVKERFGRRSAIEQMEGNGHGVKAPICGEKGKYRE